jgi:hypothetical protein
VPSPLMRPRWGNPANWGHAPSSAAPSSSCPHFARIVFANREDTARESVREHVTGDEFWDRVWTVVALEPNRRLGKCVPVGAP